LVLIVNSWKGRGGDCFDGLVGGGERILLRPFLAVVFACYSAKKRGRKIWGRLEERKGKARREMEDVANKSGI
jgi:hypothetical protein